MMRVSDFGVCSASHALRPRWSSSAMMRRVPSFVLRSPTAMM